MHAKLISLSQFQTDVQGLLNECCDSGRPLVVELPDHRLVSIQSLEADDADDTLINDLFENNEDFVHLW